METILIKIGGSIITKKGKDPVNQRTIKSLARQLIGFKGKIILVHGTGYIGKSPAIKYGYTKTKFLPRSKTRIALRISNSINKLNMNVIHCLNETGVPAISIDNTHLYGHFNKQWNRKSLKGTLDSLTTNNVIPVFYGNFLPVQQGGFRVLSSDELVLAIAKLIKPQRILFLSDVDGVMDNKILIPIFKKKMLRSVKKSENDVSGGMKMKAKTALLVKQFCDECIIARGTKKGIVKDFLKKRDIYGTRISLS